MFIAVFFLFSDLAFSQYFSCCNTSNLKLSVWHATYTIIKHLLCDNFEEKFCYSTFYTEIFQLVYWAQSFSVSSSRLGLFYLILWELLRFPIEKRMKLPLELPDSSVFFLSLPGVGTFTVSPPCPHFLLSWKFQGNEMFLSKGGTSVLFSFFFF